MINRIEIQNFLSHKHSVLELSEGVNVIVGATDSGKSAVIRALKWLITNRPTGDSFRSNWKNDETRIAIEIQDQFITRSKGGKHNEYLVTGEDGHEGEYKALGTKVPEEISKILNLNDINLQGQFESHFLLSNSPGEVATHFNKVAHLDRIDLGLQNINKWLREIQSELNHSDIELGDLLEGLNEYKDLDEIEEQIEVLEKYQKEKIELRDDINKLGSLIISLADVKEKITEAKGMIEYENVVGGMIVIMEELKVAETERESLGELLEELNDLLVYGEELESGLGMEKPINALCQIYTDIAKVNKAMNALRNHLGELDEVEDLEMSFNLDLRELEEKFHNNIGEECPLCGNKIK